MARILKSIGAAVVAIATIIAFVGILAHLLLRLSEQAVEIVFISILALSTLAVVSVMFYQWWFDPKQTPPKEVNISTTPPDVSR